MYRKFQQFIKPLFLTKSVKYTPPTDIHQHWISSHVETSRGSIATRYWLHQKNPEHKTVILVHPYDIQAKDFYLTSGHPELYHKMGFHVLIFDFNVNPVLPVTIIGSIIFCVLGVIIPEKYEMLIELIG